jgi:hypothetical protein
MLDAETRGNEEQADKTPPESRPITRPEWSVEVLEVDGGYRWESAIID